MKSHHEVTDFAQMITGWLPLSEVAHLALCSETESCFCHVEDHQMTHQPIKNLHCAAPPEMKKKTDDERTRGDHLKNTEFENVMSFV